MRLAKIGMFYYLNNAKNYYWTYKPFNPLLGETFELENEDSKTIVE